MFTFLAFAAFTLATLYAIDRNQHAVRASLLSRYTDQRLARYVCRVHFSWRYTDKRIVRFAIAQQSDCYDITDRLS